MALIWLIGWMYIGHAVLILARRSFNRLEHFAASIALGLVFGGYFNLLWSYIFEFSLRSQLFALGCSTAIAGFLWWKRPTRLVWPELPRFKPKNPLFWLTVAIGLFLLWFGLTSLTTQNGDLWINNRHNYGDIRLHLAYITNFVDGANVPVDNPIMAGSAPSYPFLIDFITAELIILGLPLTWAYNLMMVIGYGLVAGVSAAFGYRLLGSNWGAVLTSFLLLCGGGLGFFTLFLPLWAAQNWSIDFLVNSPADYSIYKESGYWLGNSLLIFFNTQRTFLLGFPLTVLILLELHNLNPGSRVKDYTTIGLMTSLLPLVHTTSLLVVALLIPFFAVKTFLWLKPSRWIVNWVGFGLPLLLFGLPLLIHFIDQAGSVLTTMRFQFGWMSEAGETFGTIWAKNGGVVLPVSLISIALMWKKKNPIAPFLLNGFGLFVLANIVVTQPWNFDNSKYLLYWYLFACVACVWMVLALWRHRQKTVAVLIVLGLTMSGMYDLARRFNRATNWFPVITQSDVARLRDIQTKIPKKSRVLTYGTMLNPVVSNLGRPMVLGDPAWIWSHGLDSATRQFEVSEIYRGGADSLGLIQKLKVDYVVISDNERSQTSVNEPFFSQFPLVYQDRATSIYQTH